MRYVKYIAVIFFLLFPVSSFATDWVKADSAIVMWDPPATFYDGTPIPADIQGWVFTVYTKDLGNGVINVAGMFGSAEAIVVLEEGDKKYVGVSAAYIDVDGIQSGESAIAWSDNPIDCQDGVTFGIHNLKRPEKPGRLRK